jgi:predicted patatin/cPLA2 family phospholipase
MQKTALVVEGGALRSVFSAGLLDGFLQQNFNPFDIYIGVSAGASNLAFYINQMQGQGFELYIKSIQSSRFIRPSRFITGGHLIDLDWLLDELIDADLKTRLLNQEEQNFYVGMTSVTSGASVYHKGFNDHLIDALKASMSLPLLYRNFPSYNGESMTDGGIANGIPVDEAIRLGANRIMVVRSRSKDYVKTDTAMHRFIRYRLRKYPKLFETLQQRIAIHERTKALISNPPEGVRIVDICPPDAFKQGRFSRDQKKLQQGYQMGTEQSRKAIELWQYAID